MKNKYKTCGIVVLMIASLCIGCGSNVKEEAAEAVASYNDKADNFNEAIKPYNEAAENIASLNTALTDAVDSAQTIINNGEEPYDPETLTALKEAMGNALSELVSTPDTIAAVEKIEADDSLKTSELKDLIEEANLKSEELDAYKISAVPEIPDYTEAMVNLADAQKAYEDSVQSLKQVTAPKDDFVIQRLETVDTISEIAAVTEDHDPNGKLGKQGGYTGTIYFRDTEVDWSKLYIESGKDNVIDVGCDGGGAVEIFASVEDAETRDAYLGAFDGTILASGGHYIVGTCIIRTSDELTGTQQLELTEKITQALIRVAD